MTLKKTFALCLTVCITAGLTACGGKEEGKSKKPALNVSELKDFSYSTLHYDYENNAGYKFDFDITCSPWIPASDRDLIESAWADLGCSGEIPYTIEDWHLRKVFNNSYGADSTYQSGKELEWFSSEITDLYISVGKLHIVNKLEDWHVTPQEPVSMNFWLKEQQHSGKMCSKVFYDNRPVMYSDPPNFLMKLDRDDDTTPFVMMFAEVKNPKNPNGEYRELAESMLLYPAKDEPGLFQPNQYDEENTFGLKIYERKNESGAESES